MLFQVRDIREIDREPLKNRIYRIMRFNVNFEDGSTKEWLLGFNPADMWPVLMANLNYHAFCDPKPISIELKNPPE